MIPTERTRGRRLDRRDDDEEEKRKQENRRTEKPADAHEVRSAHRLFLVSEAAALVKEPVFAQNAVASIDQSHEVRVHVIVDGYNLLGSRRAEGDPEMLREQMVRDLTEYRHRKGHPVTVVFDGWRQGLSAERHEHRSGVQVIYSKRGERADQVIQRLAAEFGRDCAVVSSDREVADFAKLHGALAIGADEFDARLRAMRQAGARPGMPEKDDRESPRPNPTKKGNPKKLPKAVRKRNRQLKGF
jgi:predicted RNA-binding protein with PIN domain